MSKDPIDQAFMFSALGEAQAVVRAYDSKAEILGIFLTLLVGLLGIHYHLEPALWSRVLAAVGAATMLIAMGCLGALLWPSNNIVAKINLGGYSPTNGYYLDSAEIKEKSIMELYESIKATDWNVEIVAELMKVSMIRDRKRWWFNLALIFGAATLMFEVVASVSMWF